MKVQLLSDLHNEFLRNGRADPKHKWTGLIPETQADIIVLAGDIDTGTNGLNGQSKSQSAWLKTLFTY